MPVETARLRERLMELRDDMLGRMVRKGAVEPGHLLLIAGMAIGSVPVRSMRLPDCLSRPWIAELDALRLPYGKGGLRSLR